MEEYIKNETANFQINAIKSMLSRGLSDIEIAAAFNQMKEPNLSNPEQGWLAKDIRTIISNFKLEKPTSNLENGLKTKNGVLKYKLVNTLDLGEVFLQILIWICLIVVTLGIAFPFYAYYFVRLIVNSTEVHEIT